MSYEDDQQELADDAVIIRNLEKEIKRLKTSNNNCRQEISQLKQENSQLRLKLKRAILHGKIIQNE